MTVLVLHGVSVAYASAPVIRDVSFSLEPGWFGLVGANGAGKSTLLRAIAGAIAPTEGRVEIRPAGARVVLCEQEDAPGGGSPGERRLSRVGAALAAEPDVLLVDEPTNHLDAAARARVVARLRRFRGIGIVVSHDRALLDELPRAILRVHDARVALCPGPYAQAKRAWELERRAEVDAHARAREGVRRLAESLDAARRDRAAADAKRSSRARMKSARDHDARSAGDKTLAAWAEARAGRRVAVVRAELERAARDVPSVAKDKTLGTRVFASFERAPSPVLLHLDAPSLEVAGRAVLRDVRVTIGRDERVRIAGPNGAGKSTLLRALLAPHAARVDAGRILFLPQELEPRAIASLARALDDADDATRGRVLAVVGALGSDPSRFVRRRRGDEARLSPGEARKLALALALGRRAWALVLDEPTNHMDLPSTERLEDALGEYPGAIVLVTHDDAFAARVTTRTIEVGGGGVR